MGILLSVRFNQLVRKPHYRPCISEKSGTYRFFSAAFIRNPPLYLERLDIVTALSRSTSCLIAADYAKIDTFYSSRSCDIRMTTFLWGLPVVPYVFFHNRKDLEETLNDVIVTQPIQNYVHVMEKKYYSNPKSIGKLG